MLVNSEDADELPLSVIWSVSTLFVFYPFTDIQTLKNVSCVS